MKTVIVAGGRGTRLGLMDAPKPLARIGDRMLIEHQFDLLRRHGLTDIYLLSGHLANVIFEKVKDGSVYGLRVTHIVEPLPLGTGGSLALLRHLLHDRFLLLYGDVLLDMDLGRLIAFDRRQHAAATLVIHPSKDPMNSDLVDVAEDHTISAFHPIPRLPGGHYNNLVSAGVYILSPEIFPHIACGCHLDFDRGLLPDLFRKGDRLRAYRTTEYICNVDTPEDWRTAGGDYLNGRVSRRSRTNKRPAFFLTPDILFGSLHNSFQADDAELLPNVGVAIAALNASDYLTVIASNQVENAEGILTPNALRATHKKIQTLLGRQHAFIDAIYDCPHPSDVDVHEEIRPINGSGFHPRYNADVILQAADDWNIDLSRSWTIGVCESALNAGKRAGCTTVQIGFERPTSAWADHVAADLMQCVRDILDGTFASLPALRVATRKRAEQRSNTMEAA